MWLAALKAAPGSIGMDFRHSRAVRDGLFYAVLALFLFASVQGVAYFAYWVGDELIALLAGA
ncbi:MAG: hypothetical protein EBS99_00405 [Betaproteobacteria bacterium]|jgi:hypothetical protein|nr:hypothetical protein [Betaproteobacteria bacterium]